MPDLYYIEGTSHGCGDGVTVRIRWNGARIIIYLDPNPYLGAIENLLIEKYTSACLRGNEDEQDAVDDELLDAVIGAGESILDHLVPPSAEPPSDLHSILLPPQYSFSLTTVDGTPKLLREGSYRLELSEIPGKGYKRDLPSLSPQLPSPQFPVFNVQLKVKEDLGLPRYLTTGIRVLKKLLGDGYISHVLVDGRDTCAKVGREFDGGAMQRELDCLSKITAYATQQSLKIHVPKLLGLIEMPDNGNIIGILEELIPHPKDPELSTLARIDDISTISKERRETWATQVRETVDWLHGNGIVWGDGKADNVLIHPDTDEPWLIDFGGGNTRGWVDEHLAGTSEGDDQAVRRIFEFLEVA
ncbi:hypothetical protein GGS23DRAFT_600859 [Durotheca rogersii]|uniref:uncharacterized protein n=1 Tax=Durotheca rogersii TaxID=419775 RepID=UPI00221FCB06|nr:uncharacterized protein GGS23DRAFT_600859 [Durotheca rogersii]KAI5857371.1 hypothetical protein GGS23DRAFT_600859 [Durotheca rogersii]